MKSVPILVPPSKPTPFEIIPFSRGSVMAGLNTLTASHVLIFKPDIVRSKSWSPTTAPDFEEIVLQPGNPIQTSLVEPYDTVVLRPPDASPSPLPAARAHAPTLVVDRTYISCFMGEEVETGGFILSIKLYKGICDAAGLILYLCGWAEMARGKPHVSVLPLILIMGQDIKAHHPITTTDESARHQVHLPNLEKQSIELFDEEQGTFSCQHHSKIYKPPMAERIKVDIPFEVIKAHTEWMLVEERISCTALQVLTAHVWRERTRALHIPSNVEARLFFMSKAEQDHPIAFYGSFAFNCEVKARAEDLVDMPLVYAVQLIQEAEANLVFNFTTCTNEFKQVHCSCGFVPMEVLFFTSLPTDMDKHLDFGPLGKLLTSSLDAIHFPSNVNIAAMVPYPMPMNPMSRLSRITFLLSMSMIFALYFVPCPFMDPRAANVEWLK